MNKGLIFMCLGFMLFSCGEKNEVRKTMDMQWITGVWKGGFQEGISIESWKKINDTCYAGDNVFIMHGDTLSREWVHIICRKNTWYYEPLVANQNNGQRVSFTLTHDSLGIYLFENPTHDFPTKIWYKPQGKDSLYAGISGLKEGKEEIISFRYQREK